MSFINEPIELTAEEVNEILNAITVNPHPPTDLPTTYYFPPISPPIYPFGPFPTDNSCQIPPLISYDQQQSYRLDGTNSIGINPSLIGAQIPLPIDNSAQPNSTGPINGSQAATSSQSSNPTQTDLTSQLTAKNPRKRQRNDSLATAISRDYGIMNSHRVKRDCCHPVSMSQAKAWGWDIEDPEGTVADDTNYWVSKQDHLGGRCTNVFPSKVYFCHLLKREHVIQKCPSHRKDRHCGPYKDGILRLDYGDSLTDLYGDIHGDIHGEGGSNSSVIITELKEEVAELKAEILGLKSQLTEVLTLLRSK